MTPEGHVKKKLKAYLDVMGIYHFWPVQVGYGAATVDCLACWNGRFTAIECKREGVTKPTPRQATTMKRIREAGGITYLVTYNEYGLCWVEIK